MQPHLHSRRSFLVAAATVAAGLTLKSAFGESQDLAGLTLKEASELLRRKAASPVDLTEACLNRIEAYNSTLNAFITVTRDQAMDAARAMEAEQQQGKWRGPLHGIPIALKDNIDTAGIRTTAASELFKDRVPSADAEVVRRLKNAGATLASLAQQLLEMEATGDRARVEAWFQKYAFMPPALADALAKASDVPVDIDPLFSFPEPIQ